MEERKKERKKEREKVRKEERKKERKKEEKERKGEEASLVRGPCGLHAFSSAPLCWRCITWCRKEAR